MTGIGFIASGAEPESEPLRLRVGLLLRPHGLKGLLRLRIISDEPLRRFRVGNHLLWQPPASAVLPPQTLVVERYSPTGSETLIGFAGIADRNAAEPLTGGSLWAEVKAGLSPEDLEQWYDFQLVGLEVLVLEGENIAPHLPVSVGTVTAVEHYPAQDLLSVATASGPVLVPMVKQILRSVDLPQRQIILTPPPGLFPRGPQVEPSE